MLPLTAFIIDLNQKLQISVVLNRFALLLRLSRMRAMYTGNEEELSFSSVVYSWSQNIRGLCLYKPHGTTGNQADTEAQAS